MSSLQWSFLWIAGPGQNELTDAMRLLCLLVMCGLLGAGCAGTKSAGGSSGKGASQPAVAAPGAAASGIGVTTPASPTTGIVVTPGGPITGTVAFVNPNARYAVVSFPLGAVPAAEKRFNVYRNGLKVGEIKITGPERDTNTVGDIVAGEAQKGDELREN